MADCGCIATRGSGTLLCQECLGELQTARAAKMAAAEVLGMLDCFESLATINGSAQRMLTEILLELGKPIGEVTVAEILAADAELGRRYNALFHPAAHEGRA